MHYLSPHGILFQHENKASNPTKEQYISTALHGITSQTRVIFIVTTVRTNLALYITISCTTGSGRNTFDSTCNLHSLLGLCYICIWEVYRVIRYLNWTITRILTLYFSTNVITNFFYICFCCWTILQFLNVFKWLVLAGYIKTYHHNANLTMSKLKHLTSAPVKKWNLQLFQFFMLVVHLGASTDNYELSAELWVAGKNVYNGKSWFRTTFYNINPTWTTMRWPLKCHHHAVSTVVSNYYTFLSLISLPFCPNILL